MKLTPPPPHTNFHIVEMEGPDEWAWIPSYSGPCLMCIGLLSRLINRAKIESAGLAIYPE